MEESRDIAYITRSFRRGGAGIGAERTARAIELAQAQLGQSGRVRRLSCDDLPRWRRGAWAELDPQLAAWLGSRDRDAGFRTSQLLPAQVRGAQLFDTRTVKLCHWIGCSTLSLRMLERLQGPIVLRFADLWYCLATDHSFPPSCWQLPPAKAFDRYLSSLNSAGRAYFAHKCRRLESIRRRASIIAPSGWVAEAIRCHPVLATFPLSVIPVPIEAAAWSRRSTGSREQSLAGESLRVAFGAQNILERTKGYQFVRESMKLLDRRLSAHGRGQRIILLVYGSNSERARELRELKNVEVRSLGYLDRSEVDEVQHSADLALMPSAQEAFGMIAAESMINGTPCVTFEGTGCGQLVRDSAAGYVCPPTDSAALAGAVHEHSRLPVEHRLRMGRKARAFAMETLEPTRIGGMYLEHFERYCRC